MIEHGMGEMYCNMVNPLAGLPYIHVNEKNVCHLYSAFLKKGCKSCFDTISMFHKSKMPQLELLEHCVSFIEKVSFTLQTVAMGKPHLNKHGKETTINGLLVNTRLCSTGSPSI